MTISPYAADAMELTRILELLRDDHGQLSDSLERRMVSPAYGVEALRADLVNFVFLLGCSDGEHFIDPDANSPESGIMTEGR